MALALRAQPMTVWPKAVKERTIARPKPLEQPVMRINLEGTGMKIRFFVYVYDYVYERDGRGRRRI